MVCSHTHAASSTLAWPLVPFSAQPECWLVVYRCTSTPRRILCGWPHVPFSAQSLASSRYQSSSWANLSLSAALPQCRRTDAGRPPPRPIPRTQFCRSAGTQQRANLLLVSPLPATSSTRVLSARFMSHVASYSRDATRNDLPGPTV